MAPGDLGRPRRKDKHIPLCPGATRREAVGEGTWPKGPGGENDGNRNSCPAPRELAELGGEGHRLLTRSAEL